jgi:hypothetical protein
MVVSILCALPQEYFMYCDLQHAKASVAPWLTPTGVAANRRFCLNDHCQINLCLLLQADP